MRNPRTHPHWVRARRSKKARRELYRALRRQGCGDARRMRDWTLSHVIQFVHANADLPPEYPFVDELREFLDKK